jgi:hypothetical protein
LRQAKQENFNSAKDKILGMLDLNESIDKTKSGKILGQQRRLKHLKRAKRFHKV